MASGDMDFALLQLHTNSLKDWIMIMDLENLELLRKYKRRFLPFTICPIYAPHSGMNSGRQTSRMGI